MAKFTAEQAIATVAVRQAIQDWAHELDVNNGLGMAQFLTSDVAYNLHGKPLTGNQAVQEHYTNRVKTLGEAGEVPVMRHVLSDFRFNFTAENSCEVNFQLLFFIGTGAFPMAGCDPLALADVNMTIRSDNGEWLVARFDSQQTFLRR